jgi:hypothetical protein
VGHGKTPQRHGGSIGTGAGKSGENLRSIRAVPLELPRRGNELHPADGTGSFDFLIDVLVHGAGIARDENALDELPLANGTRPRSRRLLVAVNRTKEDRIGLPRDDLERQGHSDQ